MTRSRNTLAALLTGIGLAMGLGGCAGDGTTEVETGGGSLVQLSGELIGVVGTPFGGQDGLVFSIRTNTSGSLYYWTVTGSIPANFTKLPLNDTVPSTIPSKTFTLSGTPLACGQYPIEITVHTYPEHLVLVPPTRFTITIDGACTAPDITTDSLTWFEDVTGSRQLGLEGGSPPYTWSVTGLAGPGGLTFDSGTGVISGTPVNAGIYPLGVTVSDRLGRSDSRTVDLDVRAFDFSDAKGTWSGVVERGTLIQGTFPNTTFVDLAGKRISLLLTDPIPGTDDLGNPIQVAPLSGGTLGHIVLDPEPAGKRRVLFSLLPGGGYPEPFNSPMDQLNMHFSCNILADGDLQCTGHSFSGTQYNVAVRLTRLNTNDLDSTDPTLTASLPSNGASSVTDLSVALTFSEPMSGSSSVSLSGGSGAVSGVSFDPADPTKATAFLVGIQSNTTYTLTLNPAPAGSEPFMDLAGNPLATETVAFTTGVLNARTLTVTKSGSGSGLVMSTPTGIDCGVICDVSFTDGTSVVLTAVADPGSFFVGWTSTACSGNASCNLLMSANQSVTADFQPVPTYTLTVGLNGTGSGVVTSNPTGIDCGTSSTSCESAYNDGTFVTLTAAPIGNSTFSGWGGDCSGTAPCTVQMTADRSITATFTLQSYTLSVNKTGSGLVSSNPTGISCGATCSATFSGGSTVTLTAIPDAGYTFTGWSGSGITCAGTGSCAVLMDGTKTVTATFTLIPTYTVTVTKNGSGSGTVTSNPSGITCGSTCSTTLPELSDITLTASSDTGSVFTGWSGGGCSGTAACTLSDIGANVFVTATFDPQPTQQLTVTIDGSGTGSVNSTPSGITCPTTCSGNFAQGNNVTLTAVSAVGSTFSGWSGACSGVGTCQVTMDSAKSVTATFAIQSYALTVTTSGTATGAVTSAPAGINCGSTCSANYTHGTNVTLTATPAANYTFSGWGGACSGTASCVVPMTSARSVTATFTIQTHTLTVNTSGLGSGTVTSNPAGISCGSGASACSFNFNQGQNVTLTASPAGGSAFGGWSGACSAEPCVVTMTSAQAVTATFTTTTYTLTVTKSGPGTGTVTSTPPGINCGSTCSANFVSGASVTLTATPDSGATFASWGGACSGTGSCEVSMSTLRDVTATFNIANGPVAFAQKFKFLSRLQTDRIYEYRYAITLTGSSPNPGPLTFRITRLPGHQDPIHGMNMVVGQTYNYVDPNVIDPATGYQVWTPGYVATTSSAVVIDTPSGTATVTGNPTPVVIYTPNICHDIFTQDTMEFEVIDSAGLVSEPATITMDVKLRSCPH